MTCEICGFESDYEDEVCYYDINGYAVVGDQREGAGIDGLAFCICAMCAEQ